MCIINSYSSKLLIVLLVDGEENIYFVESDLGFNLLRDGDYDFARLITEDGTVIEYYAGEPILRFI